MRICLKSFYLVIARILSKARETKQSQQLEIATPVFGLVRNDNEKGQTLVELLLAIGLAGIILPALLTGLVASRSGKAQQAQRLEAVAILKETEEAVRNVRENDWNAFAVNGTFHAEISGSSWILATGSATINGFTRSVVISAVERDANGAIVASGGTVDPSSKKLVVTISWGTPLPTSIQSTIYLMRLDNITYAETTEVEFNNGTKNGVAVTNTSGGEVLLGSGGQGNWCQPATPSGSMVLDLPKNGAANALAAIEGSAFVGTGENASGVSFAKVNISNANPPVATLGATFDGHKTNDVFGETNYAYLATDTNSKEIVIIDLNNIVAGKYQEAGFFDSPGSTDGESVYVLGSTGFMTAGSTLYSFDLTSKSGSRAQLDPDGVTLAGTGNKVVVNGSYAYVAVNSTTNQLQIIDVSNPNNMSVVGQASVGNVAALDFDGTDDRVDNLGTFDVIGSAMTITAWVFADSNGFSNDMRIISKANGIQDINHWWMLSEHQGNLRFRLKTNGVTSVLIAGPLNIGAWMHVAAVYDGSNMILYKNGVEQGRMAKTGTISTDNTIKVAIGSNPTLYGPWDGRIDEVHVYDRAFSAGEVASAYNQGVSARLGGSFSLGLVSYWNFDEGTGQIVNDSAGPNNGTRGTSTLVESSDPAWTLVNAGNQGATDIFVNETGSRAYLVTKNSATNREFFIIDTSIKTGNRPVLGTYDANGMDPKGVTVVTGNKAIIVGDGAEEYQVIDISNESSPIRCGGLDVGTDINGISSVLELDGDAYSYIIAEDATEEFQILASGSGGQYASSADFTSQTIPIPMPANQTSFNRFEVSLNRPSQTDIKFQVAIEQAISNSCSGVTFNFVGEDGTNSSFFQTSVTSGTQAFDYAIPVVINPGQCFRYKIFLSTIDSSQTPIFYDITVNYAP